MTSKIGIGLSMLFCLGEPFSSLLRHLHEVDVRNVEIVDESLHSLNSKRIKTLKKITQSRGIKLTLHAPFVDINIASPNRTLRRVILRRLEKSILYARQLNCRLWVFHPGLKTGVSGFYPGLDWRLNIESVHSLIETARRYDVEIAIENVPDPYPFLLKNLEDFSCFYDELGEDLGMVLDIGHANLTLQIQEFIDRFSDKIIHVHVSDNDGTSDLHLGIGYGTINWEEVAREIKRVKYEGVVMLESTEHVKESLKTLCRLFV